MPWGPGADGVDVGLLAPAWAGTEAAALTSDEAWLRAMLDVEVALARVQARLGVIPEDAVGPIARAAGAPRLDVAATAAAARGTGNPVVALVRKLAELVAEEDPRAAEYVHRGGTSQDVVDSATMLVAGRVLDRVAADLVRTARAMAGLADEYRHTPMAGRTLTQHAVPITFGLKAAGWLNLVLDALAAVRGLRRTGLPAQLGGAAGTLASYAEYAKAAGAGSVVSGVEMLGPFAEELGLAEPVLPWHAARTPVATLGSVLSLVTGALGKFAVDVQVMSRTEVAEVAERPAEGRGASSAMPQKRNPVLATLVVAAARQVPAHALVLAQSMLAEDERSAGGWQAEWQPLRECLRLAAAAAGTAAELAEGLTVFPDRLRANLEATGGAVLSERLTAVLAPVLGKAAAKDLLGRIAHAAADGRGGFRELLVAEPGLAERLGGQQRLRELLDPRRYLGASAELVDRALARFRADTAEQPTAGQETR